jgi:hypothetical protein
MFGMLIIEGPELVSTAFRKINFAGQIEAEPPFANRSGSFRNVEDTSAS